MRLHQRSWASRGQMGVFASEKFTRFHRTLSILLVAKKQTRVFLLCDGERAIAALHVFVYNNTVHLYQSGYAPNDVVHSPGTLIRALAIAQCIDEGRCEWDFLKAEAQSYKYRWSKHTRRIVQARLAPLQPKEAILTTAQSVVNGLRQVKCLFKQ